MKFCPACWVLFVEDIFSSLQDFVPSFLENLTDDELKKEAKNEAKNDALSSIIKVFRLVKFVWLLNPFTFMPLVVVCQKFPCTNEWYAFMALCS